MRSLEHLRRLLFWTLDFLRGSTVRKHYRDISFILNDASPEESGRIHERNLRCILKHAIHHCPYYSGLKDRKYLSEFPVVNKSLIKSHMNQFLAIDNDRRKLFRVITSGSTGTPFQTFQDQNKKNRNFADTIYFAGLAGYKIGHRLIYLKIWVEEKMRNRMDYWFQNMVPVDVIRLNDEKIGYLLERIKKDPSTFGILGYASALELICRFLDSRISAPFTSRVKSIIAISETLNEYTKSGMERYFGVPVVSRYSNLENGIIAQQIPGVSGKFLINTASYHVEILKMDSDEPVEDGELGRIVVTDLYNYAMPMIRYDTGDVGAIESNPSYGPGLYFSKVEGRKLDLLYDTGGNLISSYIVYKNMWQYTEIDQYQLIQEGADKYTFKINTNRPFLKEQQLIDEFKSFLGKDADFRVAYVNEIPLLASGKRKKIVNNYIKP